MSTEQRDVRPFEPLPSLDVIVKGCVLHLGAHTAEDGESIAVSAIDYAERRLRVSLPWESEEEAKLLLKQAITEVESAGYPVSKVALAFIAHSSFLKLRDVIAIIPLADLESMTAIEVHPRPAALQTPQSGSRLTVSFVLLEGTEPRVLRAWRKGAWLHRSSFGLTTNLSQLGFNPRPLTDEERETQKLPKGTLRYIVLHESPIDDGVSEDMVEMWVDSDLLHNLSTQSTSPMSRVMQAQLFVDCIGEIIAAALADPNFADSGWQDIEGTLLGRVVMAIVPSPTTHEAEARNTHYGIYLDLIRKDPSRFLAHAESIAELRKRHKEAMEV